MLIVRLLQISLAALTLNGAQIVTETIDIAATRKAADQGDAKAQFDVGLMYVKGLGVTKNEIEALKWFRKAADQGYVNAQNNLGLMYAFGLGSTQGEVEATKWLHNTKPTEELAKSHRIGLKVDDVFPYDILPRYTSEFAVKWFRTAADQGNVAAQTSLGLIFAQGLGVPKDEAESVKWFQKAAEQGDASAQNNLGIMYSEGRGITKDEVEAIKWIRKAAEQEVGEAQFNLGLIYAQGRGVSRDEIESSKWLLKAAAQGFASNQSSPNLIYAKGNSVRKDEVEAVKWLLKAAEKGVAEAQYNLGLMYAQGRGLAKHQKDELESTWHDLMVANRRRRLDEIINSAGVKDFQATSPERTSNPRKVEAEVKSVNWLRKAADQNLAKAQYELGMMYAKGRGVTKDEVEAVKWFRKAAEQGLSDAQYELGVAFAFGQGVAKDEAEAVKWFRKAIEQGHVAAKLSLKDKVPRGSTSKQRAVSNIANLIAGPSISKVENLTRDEVEAYLWFDFAVKPK